MNDRLALNNRSTHILARVNRWVLGAHTLLQVGCLVQLEDYSASRQGDAAVEPGQEEPLNITSSGCKLDGGCPPDAARPVDGCGYLTCDAALVMRDASAMTQEGESEAGPSDERGAQRRGDAGSLPDGGRQLACGDACASDCGDGLKSVDEECDDGNQEREACELGEAECTVCDESCRFRFLVPICGDGAVNTDAESCDDGNRATEECEYGLQGCMICDASCQRVEGASHFCGDGVQDVEEYCDDGEYNGRIQGGCAADCQALFAVCGDGVVNGLETCDLAEQNGVPGLCDQRCGAPWFMDMAAPNGGTGLSWEDPFNNFESALNALENAGGGQLWVAAGDHLGSSSFGNEEPTLVLRPYVRVYGGFDGTEAALEDRDWRLNRSRLVGGYHNVVGASYATLDGFWIEAGNAGEAQGEVFLVGEGGGLAADGVEELTVQNCVFVDNSAMGGGGAIVARDSSLTLDRVEFDGNRSNYGVAGVDALRSELLIRNSVFVGQSGLNFSGIRAVESQLSLRDSDFVGNDNAILGVLGVFTSSGRSEIVNVSFHRNSGNGSADGGAATLVVDTSTVTVTNSNFIYNSSLEEVPLVRGGEGLEVQNSWIVEAVGSEADIIATVSNNCRVATGMMSSPTILEEDRDGDGITEFYITGDFNPCVNQGNDALAEAAGLDWTRLSTDPTDCTDVSPVDPGRHYVPLSDTVGPCSAWE